MREEASAIKPRSPGSCSRGSSLLIAHFSYNQLLEESWFLRSENYGHCSWESSVHVFALISWSAVRPERKSETPELLQSV